MSRAVIFKINTTTCLLLLPTTQNERTNTRKDRLNRCRPDYGRGPRLLQLCNLTQIICQLYNLKLLYDLVLILGPVVIPSILSRQTGPRFHLIVSVQTSVQ